ncbi:MAG TPA: multicopper oxidase family protein [Acidobacteriaceae bacterium]|nr:multicopper oxidase family protein [Acidobacteriaceae bacterium]
MRSAYRSARDVRGILSPGPANALVEPATLLHLLLHPMNRRDFLVDSARVLAGTSLQGRSFALAAQPQPLADYTIRIAPIQLEIAPGKTVRTTAFNGRVPGELIRVREGQQVTIDVINETDAADIVHWHGLQIPSVQDGATEEGSPESAPHGGKQRFIWIARPAGFRWYHSHTSAGHNLNRATYTGEFGFLMIDPTPDPARYDLEIFLALHNWNGHAQGGSEGYQEVVYDHQTINDRMLGFGEPIRVREGQRVLFHVLNASATLMHDLALPGHRFLVTALDGNPVPTPSLVETLRLGPAERIDAVVEMNQPGVWILGETDPAVRKAGMGIVVEYAGRSGAPVWRDPSRFDFQYENFSAPSPDSAPDPREVVVPLVFKPKFEGYGDFDHWTINGLSWPRTETVQLKEGTRYRLVFDNQSTDIHPVHLHRHTFELKSLNRKPVAGVLKDVVLLETGVKTEVVFTANNPGKTLFHCHQQDHMDSGFMMLFDYA